MIHTHYRISFILLLVIIIIFPACHRHTTIAKTGSTFEDSCSFVNALELRIVNRGFNDAETPYQRLPAYLKDSVSENLWFYQKHCAGIAVRFRTNSSYIGIRYKLLMDFCIPNMAYNGIKGTDLYAYSNDGTWQYVQTSKPEPNANGYIVKPYVRNVDSTKYTEYMVYLPLYDGVESVEIGISPTAVIDAGDSTLISHTDRIVAYGTSIMQGGAASRTGMAATNIICRETGREVINLGFSSQGKMDYAVARAMATIPNVTCYIVDPVPNCSSAMCDTLTYGFIEILAKGNPDAAIVMVGGPRYPHSRFDTSLNHVLTDKNEAFYKNYIKLKARYPRVHYVEGLKPEDFDGDDYGTVDGIHLSNLGFRRYCDRILPVLNSCIHK